MASVPKPYAAQLPASDNFSQRPRIIQKSLARAKGEFVHGVKSEILADIEDAWPLVTGETVNVFRAIRLAATYRSVVNGVRPGVAGFEGEPVLHAVFK